MSIRVMLSKKKQPTYVFDDSKAPTVTIQIPTYNELAALRCAKKCLDFDYPKDRYNIIIGDDSNNPDISATILDFAEKHDNVEVLRRGHNLGFKPGNLNYMLSRTKGDIIVIFDSDFTPEKDFLRRIVSPFINNPNISAVQARWKFLDRNKNLTAVLGSTIGTLFHFICLPFINTYTKISFLCGSAEAIRKKDLIKLGGWKSGSFTEDIEFSLRLLKNGKKILYLEDLECAGEVPHHAKDLYKQQMRWAYGVISSFKEHFASIVKTNKIVFKEKFFIWFFCSGYSLSFLLMLLFLTGTLSFVTNTPGPIDFAKFFSQLGRNIILTSGIILASTFALIKSKNIRKFFSMLAASFSIGIVVTFYVNLGILKVLFNRPMHWFMLNKEGNKLNTNNI